MSWGLFARVTPVAGISVLGLGVGLAVSACGPATSSAAAGTGVASTAASTPVGTVAPSSTPATASSSAPAPAGSTVTRVPIDRSFVLWNCENKPEVRPTSFVLACADGNDRLVDMHWTNWTPAGAAGTVVQYLNDCTPNCAIGHFHSYPADITLTGSYEAGPNEPFAYTKVTLTYTGARPAVYVKENGKVVATHPPAWSQELPLYHPSA